MNSIQEPLDKKPKLYKKPTLRVYGDIRAMTASFDMASALPDGGHPNTKSA